MWAGPARELGKALFDLDRIITFRDTDQTYVLQPHLSQPTQRRCLVVARKLLDSESLNLSLSLSHLLLGGSSLDSCALRSQWSHVVSFQGGLWEIAQFDHCTYHNVTLSCTSQTCAHTPTCSLCLFMPACKRPVPLDAQRVRRAARRSEE